MKSKISFQRFFPILSLVYAAGLMLVSFLCPARAAYIVIVLLWCFGYLWSLCLEGAPEIANSKTYHLNIALVGLRLKVKQVIFLLVFGMVFLFLEFSYIEQLIGPESYVNDLLGLASCYVGLNLAWISVFIPVSFKEESSVLSERKQKKNLETKKISDLRVFLKRLRPKKRRILDIVVLFMAVTSVFVYNPIVFFGVAAITNLLNLTIIFCGLRLVILFTHLSMSDRFVAIIKNAYGENVIRELGYNGIGEAAASSGKNALLLGPALIVAGGGMVYKHMRSLDAEHDGAAQDKDDKGVDHHKMVAAPGEQKGYTAVSRTDGIADISKALSGPTVHIGGNHIHNPTINVYPYHPLSSLIIPYHPDKETALAAAKGHDERTSSLKDDSSWSKIKATSDQKKEGPTYNLAMTPSQFKEQFGIDIPKPHEEKEEGSNKTPDSFSFQGSSPSSKNMWPHGR